jgi:hypothetical protein
MKFASFIAITGLAFAAPITPITPVNTDKQLTVEPAVVYKRQSTLSTALDAAHGDLPASPLKRGLPTSGLPIVGSLGGVKRGLPTSGLPIVGSLGGVKRGLPSASALTGAVPAGLPALPTKRQIGGLGGLVPGSDSAEDDSEDAELDEPKTPKEPKEPSSIADGTDSEDDTEDDTAASSTDSATSALSGLPVGKRQLGGLGGLLGGDDKEATPEPAADADADTGHRRRACRGCL